MKLEIVYEQYVKIKNLVLTEVREQSPELLEKYEQKIQAMDAKLANGLKQLGKDLAQVFLDLKNEVPK